MNLVCPAKRKIKRKLYALLLLIFISVVVFQAYERFVMANPQQPQTPHYPQKDATGKWLYTNHLIDETSPYLLQHAHNPVNWYAWGKEAFEAARKLGRPILLSVGYSTCYWCHVMERQCFENPDIAAIMNEHFICIKVDREERPDVDDVYMAAVQVLTGSGGWPMNVWLTPPGAGGEKDRGLKPFYAGTYFPPTEQYGRPSFSAILGMLTNAWTKQPKELVARAERVAQAIREHLSYNQQPGELDESSLSQTVSQLLDRYDSVNGGFGAAPKFPQSANLLFLLERYQQTKNPEYWSIAADTFNRMAQGGMYDQVGGGFHRYSTDAHWLVPHFEKMLYDNGQLAEAYITAYQMEMKYQAKTQTRSQTQSNQKDLTFYARIAREICDYVLREMTDASGAFWSAQDAEVNTREGLNYLWQQDQFKQAIVDPTLRDLAIKMYGLDKGTNFQDPHHQDDPKQNVLYLPIPLDELANQQKMTLAKLIKDKQAIDKQLLTVREKRNQPSTDDKVLVAWNGMMIAGMARVGGVLKEEYYVKKASRAAQAILEKMKSPDGGLYRSMREGKAKIPAFLDDYAWFTHSLLVLYQTTKKTLWLNHAKRLMQYASDHFAATTGGYYDTLANQTDLFVRTRSLYDGALPSANGQMIHNLLKLYQVTGEQKYLTQAKKDLESFAKPLALNGAGMVHMQNALSKYLSFARKQLKANENSSKVSTNDSTEVSTKEFDKESTKLLDKAHAKSQANVVVEVSMLPREIHFVEGSATVDVVLDIGSAYHLNSHDVASEGLLPTTLRLLPKAGFKLRVNYPKALEKRYPLADQVLSIYQGRVTLKATILHVDPKVIASELKLVLSYQACTEQSCLPSREVVLPLMVK